MAVKFGSGAKKKNTLKPKLILYIDKNPLNVYLLDFLLSP